MASQIIRTSRLKVSAPGSTRWIIYATHIVSRIFERMAAIHLYAIAVIRRAIRDKSIGIVTRFLQQSHRAYSFLTKYHRSFGQIQSNVRRHAHDRTL
jgi:hypothetical protein